MLKKWWILFLLGLCTALPLYATVTEDYEAVLLEADGAIVDFAFGFKVFADTDIVVALVDEDSVGTVQTITTDYTVALNTTSDGGTVTFSEAPDEDYDVSITRAMPLTQATNIPNLGLFKAKHLENALDKLTLVVQDQGAALDRAVLQNPYGDVLEITLPAASSGAFLGWNADADALENKTDPSSLPAATDDAILYGSGTAWAVGSVDGTTVELVSGVLGIKDGGVDTEHIADGAVTAIRDAIVQTGTWTPTFAGSTTAGAMTYYSQVGNYTKIGNVVFVTAYIHISTISVAPEGDLRITGLPFTSNGTYQGGGMSMRGITVVANTVQVNTYAVNGQKYLLLQQLVNGTNQVYIQGSALGDNDVVSINMFYFTSD